MIFSGFRLRRFSIIALFIFITLRDISLAGGSGVTRRRFSFLSLMIFFFFFDLYYYFTTLSPIFDDIAIDATIFSRHVYADADKRWYFIFIILIRHWCFTLL